MVRHGKSKTGQAKPIFWNIYTMFVSILERMKTNI